ncbi:MAG: CUAEP/CCAEP-tail radical SAM protein [Candidatus Promineifilaceae bacterium]
MIPLTVLPPKPFEQTINPTSPILLLACYELGHQPLTLAWPLAFLKEAGLTAVGIDLSLDAFPVQSVLSARFIGISVPMHTALRLGVQAARQVRQINPGAHICFYGLYAWLNRDYLLGKRSAEDENGRPLADSVLSGEYEDPLLALTDAVLSGQPAANLPGVSTATSEAEPTLTRLSFPRPNRSNLPALDKYAHYIDQGYRLVAGYTEASRGCLHTCHHCPVVPIYDGRFFIVPAETVMEDIRQQVAAGARHITFGDPDFLNGPGHVLKIARTLHQEFPHVTFDFTTKVEHILEKADLIPELQQLGATFVISAFESVSDKVLERLQKGHTAADMDRALEILAEAGLPVQPTWVAFTPWTTLEDYLIMLKWIRTRELIQNVPAVQLSIRLLVPPNSALLNQPDTKEWLGALDAANFTYRWEHPDPRMETLQMQVTQIAETAGDDDPYTTFAAIEEAAYTLAGKAAPVWKRPLIPNRPPPRLTEDWFCCAEPTATQIDRI